MDGKEIKLLLNEGMASQKRSKKFKLLNEIREITLSIKNFELKRRY